MQDNYINPEQANSQEDNIDNNTNNGNTSNTTNTEVPTDPYVEGKAPIEYTKDIDPDSLLLPPSTHDELASAIESIGNIIEEVGVDHFTPKTLRALRGLNTMLETLPAGGVGTAKIEPEDNGNSFLHDGKVIGMRKLSTSGTSKRASSRIRARLNIGLPIQVVLWNSGIVLNLHPPKPSEVSSLVTAIANREILLGNSTNKLIYSNYSVVLDSILIEFISHYIASHNVILDEDEDIMDLILTNDLDTLYIGMVKAIYPNGYSVNKPCANFTEIVDNAPLCSNAVGGKCSPDDLIRVKRKTIDAAARHHLSKRTPGSVTVKEVKAYQKSQDTNKSEVIKFEYDNNTIEFTLKIPTINERLAKGEYWIEDIISRTHELFTEETPISNKRSMLLEISLTAAMGMYNSYISKVRVSSEGYPDDVLTDSSEITDLINDLSEDGEFASKVISSITKYIGEHNKVGIGYAEYVCPTCVENNVGKAKENKFKFIPLNVGKHFFDLAALKRLLSQRMKSIV